MNRDTRISFKAYIWQHNYCHFEVSYFEYYEFVQLRVFNLLRKIMAKPIKSTTRKLLFTMINKYEEVKSDLNSKCKSKIQQFDKIATFTG
jgi:hypothetical protein